MRKFTSLFLCLSLVFMLACCVSASTLKVVDYANLLTADEEVKLEQKAQAIVDQYQMDVVIVTVNDLGGKSSEAYADDYFDYNGYGIGENFSGVLLLISMGERDWAISTCGDTIYALTDYGIQKLFSSFSSDLSSGNYYDAFDTYLDKLPDYFEAYKNGKPIDGYSGNYEGPGSINPPSSDDVVYYDEPVTASDIVSVVLLSLAVGAIVAGVTVWIMSFSMNTAKKQNDAEYYFVKSSFNLISAHNFFLYTHTDRQRKSENNGGGSHGGHRGGSSVHRSSSGRSHGGRSGKF